MNKNTILIYMKSLNAYIFEAKGFTLSDSERNALECVLGFVTGNLGDKKDIELYKKFVDTLKENDIESLNSLYDLISNTETYPKLTKRSFNKEELSLLKSLLVYIDENDIYGDFEYELSNILDVL